MFKLGADLGDMSADASYDAIAAKLVEPGFRPRQLFKDFNIEVLATTDDPLDNLASHKAIAEDPTFNGRVLPTFRPDAYLNIAHPTWSANVDRLIDAAGDGASGYAGYITALENRRRYFVEHGAVSADHGVATPATLKLDRAEAERIFELARAGKATAEDRNTFEAHMMYQMGRMSVEDGLVMTIHPGSFRNHHTPTFEAFGADTGHDIPFAINYTEGIRPICCRTSARPRTSTWCCSPWTRPSSPANWHRWPGSTRPSTLAHPGGSWTPRMRCSGSAPP